MADVDEQAWNALVDPNDPFTEYGFLRALEESGSVGRAAGWLPVHLLAHREERLVGAIPLYLKNHSYGEYIFDWGWAEAAQRAGLAYYPKLVSAVPFTPATGRRVLTGPGDLDKSIARPMIEGLRAVASTTKAHSIHLLFVTPEEHSLIQESPDFIPRVTHQFHWQNNGYRDFEHWLSFFRSRRRKEVRRERRQAFESGARVRIVPGSALTPDECAIMREFYEDTIDRKYSTRYLSNDFFARLGTDLAESCLVFLAEAEGAVVAGALTFQRGQHLYGRYWGCRPGWAHLHFELCYHAPIECCILNNWTRFEAGAQGMHKIQRGLMPARTFSAHLLAHSGLARAVREATTHELNTVELELTALRRHGPFRRGAGPEDGRRVPLAP